MSGNPSAVAMARCSASIAFEHVAAALSQMASRSDIVLLRLCNYDNLDASVTYKDARFTRH